MEAFAIVTACDNQYAQHTSVMLRSLIENNPKTEFRIFVLIPSDFHPNLELMIKDSMPDQGYFSLVFTKLCHKKLAVLKISGWVTQAVYYRLMIAKLIPEFSRALYLDSDIVVTGEISDLLHLDISNYVLAAALDVSCDTNPNFKRTINLEQSIPYFNSGVMLLNLDKWRSENIGGRALEFAGKNPQWIVFWDQCALNSIIRGDFLILPKEWNFQTPDVDLDLMNKGSIERAQCAKIVHFTTSDKPWHFMNNHPLKGLYWRYLKMTKWQDYVEPDRSFQNEVLKFLRLHFRVFKKAVLRFLRSHFPGISPSIERVYKSIRDFVRS